MVNEGNAGRVLIYDDPKEFLKAIEEMQAQYLARHENGVGENEK